MLITQELCGTWTFFTKCYKKTRVGGVLYFVLYSELQNVDMFYTLFYVLYFDDVLDFSPLSLFN